MILSMLTKQWTLTLLAKKLNGNISRAKGSIVAVSENLEQSIGAKLCISLSPTTLTLPLKLFHSTCFACV